MSVSPEIGHLFSMAMNPDEVSQVQFASQIKDVMAPFPPSWISTQFVSFLTSWLPLNNKNVMKHVFSAIPDIVQKAESISSLSPFFEAVLSSENPIASTTIEEVIKGNQKSTQIDDLLQNLIQSQYDAVRAFVPRVIQFASSDQTKLKMFKKLLTDASFTVRFEVTKYVPLLPEKAAIYFANALTKDVHPRIRSTLPIRFVKFNFFISTIATNLKSDSDWSVRACLCSQLPLCQELEKAGSIALELINDSVWQVSYSALKAYSAILSANETATVENAPVVLESLSKSIQTASQSCLKFAVLDTFFGVASRSSIPADSLVQFSDSILDSQPSPIKLHYIEGITKSGKPELVNLIKDNATTIIEELLKDDKWRIRLGTVQILHSLSKLLGPESFEKFLELCKAATEDSAFPVKEAAFAHIAETFLPGKVIPEWINEMGKADSFRKRQAAVMVLGIMSEKTDDPAFKETIIAAIKPFAEDPYSNVSSLALKYQ